MTRIGASPPFGRQAQNSCPVIMRHKMYAHPRTGNPRPQNKVCGYGSTRWIPAGFTRLCRDVKTRTTVLLTTGRNHPHTGPDTTTPRPYQGRGGTIETGCGSGLIVHPGVNPTGIWIALTHAPICSHGRRGLISPPPLLSTPLTGLTTLIRIRLLGLLHAGHLRSHHGEDAPQSTEAPFPRERTVISVSQCFDE